MASRYHILDEPTPGAMASVAVQPLWPLLGIMFGGSWLSWPWFAVNGFAVGSPTRGRELAVAVGGFVGNIVLGLAIGVLLVTDTFPDSAIPYLILVHLVWKLAVSYWLYVMQARTFGIYEYYGGTVRNGMLFLAAAYLIGSRVVGPLLDSYPLLRLVFS